MDVVIKKGGKLTSSELEEINRANLREFKSHVLPKEYIERAIFFILLDGENILGKGEMHPIEPVYFNGERFSIMALGGIVANEKRKGHGRRILSEMGVYLNCKDKTGVGFCDLDNKGFYEKCGFKTDTELIKRFVYYERGRKIVGEEDEVVFYKDGSDKFIEKVLSGSGGEVVFPEPPNW